MTNSNQDLLTANGAVLGHPSGLFVLFFTEMWERFSYYGMRALLIMFFTASLIGGGWGWPAEYAYAIFGTYVSMVYLSTLVGGYVADNIIGYRNSVALGALLMAMGHACMALETSFFIYTGLTLLVIGSGFFKPCMTSIISEMYEKYPEKKDGAYTIFYMGVNSGSFLGILLCGYLGERIGWSWGFGLAGIFMVFGLLQFWFAQGIFQGVGGKPVAKAVEIVPDSSDDDSDKRNPFTKGQIVWAALAGIMGFVWVINDPVSTISEGATNFLNFSVAGFSGPTVTIFTAFIIFIVLTVYRLTLYSRITRDRMIAVWFFCIVNIFFWAVFEQAPGSLTIFARDFTDRVLEGNSAMIFKVVNSLITLIPLSIFTWLVFLLYKQIGKKYLLSNVFLGISFLIIWGIALWMLQREFSSDQSEIPASWFGILNALYIIIFAPLFSRWWESKYNPSANIKYALGMFLLGLGMACIAFGASEIPAGAAPKSIGVSVIWLILVYLFHTLGELCISPVALSLVSKLSPGRMMAFMYGIYYLAIAIGMKLASIFGGASVSIAEEQGISQFFWILTLISIVLGVFCIFFYPLMKRLMHGVK
ncbi:MAG: oligopeptide:H+ symporter [Bacteroidota bacterium]